MNILDFFKQNVVSTNENVPFHFPQNLGKIKALAAIDKARIENGSDLNALGIIAFDLQNIANYGYVAQNKLGFWYDYSEFV